jgi:hypothetical protein
VYFLFVFGSFAKQYITGIMSDDKKPSRPGVGGASLAPLAKYKLVFLGDQSVGKTAPSVYSYGTRPVKNVSAR